MSVIKVAVRSALSFAFALALLPALAQAPAKAAATPRPEALPTRAPAGPNAPLPTLATQIP